jgi:hypothetical protein
MAEGPTYPSLILIAFAKGTQAIADFAWGYHYDPGWRPAVSSLIGLWVIADPRPRFDDVVTANDGVAQTFLG